MSTLTVHSTPVAACATFVPTRFEAFVLRMTARVDVVVEHRMLRRAERAASPSRAAQHAAAERQRVAEAAHLLGLHPR